MFVGRCSLFVVCCLIWGACAWLSVVFSFVAARCLLFVVCSVLLRVVRSLWLVVCCLLFVVGDLICVVACSCLLSVV